MASFVNQSTSCTAAGKPCAACVTHQGTKASRQGQAVCVCCVCVLHTRHRALASVLAGQLTLAIVDLEAPHLQRLDLNSVFGHNDHPAWHQKGAHSVLPVLCRVSGAHRGRSYKTCCCLAPEAEPHDMRGSAPCHHLCSRPSPLPTKPHTLTCGGRC